MLTITALLGGLLTLVLAFAEKIAFAIVVLLAARWAARTVRRWQRKGATLWSSCSARARTLRTQLVTKLKYAFGPTVTVAA